MNLSWEEVGGLIPDAERAVDPTQLILQMRGLLASVVHLHTGEDRGKAKAHVAEPLDRLVSFVVGESYGRLRDGSLPAGKGALLKAGAGRS